MVVVAVVPAEHIIETIVILLKGGGGNIVCK